MQDLLLCAHTMAGIVERQEPLERLDEQARVASRHVSAGRRGSAHQSVRNCVGRADPCRRNVSHLWIKWRVYLSGFSQAGLWIATGCSQRKPLLSSKQRQIWFFSIPSSKAFMSKPALNAWTAWSRWWEIPADQREAPKPPFCSFSQTKGNEAEADLKTRRSMWERASGKLVASLPLPHARRAPKSLHAICRAKRSAHPGRQRRLLEFRTA